MRRFFARHPGRRRRDLGRAEIEAFLLEPSREKGVTNWQLAQARDALELYYERFRGIALAPRLSGAAGERSEPAAVSADNAPCTISSNSKPDRSGPSGQLLASRPGALRSGYARMDGMVKGGTRGAVRGGEWLRADEQPHAEACTTKERRKGGAEYPISNKECPMSK